MKLLGVSLSCLHFSHMFSEGEVRSPYVLQVWWALLKAVSFQIQLSPKHYHCTYNVYCCFFCLTERVIAMSFPSSGVRALYRNPIGVGIRLYITLLLLFNYRVNTLIINSIVWLLGNRNIFVVSFLLHLATGNIEFAISWCS